MQFYSRNLVDNHVSNVEKYFVILQICRTRSYLYVRVAISNILRLLGIITKVGLNYK